MTMIDKYGDSEQKEQVVITGLRPGEKRYEELYYDDENIRELDKTMFVGSLKNKNFDSNAFVAHFDTLDGVRDEAAMRSYLAKAIK